MPIGFLRVTSIDPTRKDGFRLLLPIDSNSLNLFIVTILCFDGYNESELIQNGDFTSI